mmetsp:Transcript_6810/g.9916  ORF Transcript_6810/g.9916 Transcript_6810/m.9916 type:complete len:356 (+) Transcript_6810:37-1104(+)
MLLRWAKMICAEIQPSSTGINHDDMGRQTCSSRAYSRRNSVFLFREFILSTYGEYLFSNKNGDNYCSATDVDQPIVLDMAGGKGNLSWLLENVDCIQSVIFDPRLSSHIHLEKSVHYLLQHPTEASQRSIPDQPTHQPLATLLLQHSNVTTKRRPKQVRIHVTDHLVQALHKEVATKKQQFLRGDCSIERRDSSWSEYIYDALAFADATEKSNNMTLPKNNLECVDKMATVSLNSDAGAGECISDPQVIFDIFNRAKLIVGFHPDQATESCIDLANLLGIPFAICPCCVFPKEFPNRSYLGNKVIHYDEFLEYLKAKPSIATTKVAKLKTIKGTSRNIVLYSLPTLGKATELNTL